MQVVSFNPVSTSKRYTEQERKKERKEKWKKNALAALKTIFLHSTSKLSRFVVAKARDTILCIPYWYFLFARHEKHFPGTMIKFNNWKSLESLFRWFVVCWITLQWKIDSEKHLNNMLKKRKTLFHDYPQWK